MSFFSLTLSHENTNPVKQQETQNSEKNNVKNSKFNRLINIIGYCVIYIVNILTNHGKYTTRQINSIINYLIYLFN